ncbi:MAG: 3-hydroxyisobutyrate dehydrogenase [Solirubrobacteraceae bacterium]|jgi:3-hydroxyisobutyrate dehydrogenase-like beta-hydroxyacid dehydrogenase|nr:3-hydroxyisobutyrate dehydrogenase [Solirubrobacteraceae bacterium]
MAEPIRRVAFLGLGIMGRPMAANVCRAGFDLTVWNRTAERAESFAEEHRGPDVAHSPAEAAKGADAIITMVPDSAEVEEVMLAAADGMSPGALAIDMSTIAPTATRDIAGKLRERAGVGFLDAPVTGSRPKAEDGTLTIMVGGSEEDFERARPVFEAMGALVVHVGPSGHGEMVKLINNTLAAVNAAALAEGVLLAEAAGLDSDSLRQVVGAGAGSSTMLDIKAGPMFDRDFTTLFKLEHMLKDVRHCIDEAAALGLDLPLAKLAESLYARADQNGLGTRDFAAVIDVMERKNP